ncbi:MAG: hypothetical protein V1921_07385 [Candidatus Altiarchaeota archaeon]
MELYYNKETGEYVFIEGSRTLTVSEKEFQEMKKAGMSGILLRLSRDQKREKPGQTQAV